MVILCCFFMWNLIMMYIVMKLKYYVVMVLPFSGLVQPFSLTYSVIPN